MVSPVARAEAFCARFGLRLPVLLAPMSGVPSIPLASAVAAAGGMAGCGALTFDSEAIADWMHRFRQAGGGRVLLNLWVPDPAPARDAEAEARMVALLAAEGAAPGSLSPGLQDFEAQCAAVVAARPDAVSSIMGLFEPSQVTAFRAAGIAWFATVTTPAEARAAVAAGADAVIAQGAEAGGHRGAFDAARAEAQMVGLMSLLPAVADAVEVPVIAAGGIADGRGLAAALALGASAVSVGTAFLRCEEAGIAPVWAAALAEVAPEGTVPTRAFSGRLGRAVDNRWTRTVAASGGALPYPLQRAATAALRERAARDGDVELMQMWAGQSAAICAAMPAAQRASRLWQEARELLA